jgi:hypothetical protein
MVQPLRHLTSPHHHPLDPFNSRDAHQRKAPCHSHRLSSDNRCLAAACSSQAPSYARKRVQAESDIFRLSSWRVLASCSCICTSPTARCPTTRPVSRPYFLALIISGSVRHSELNNKVTAFPPSRTSPCDFRFFLTAFPFRKTIQSLGNSASLPPCQTPDIVMEQQRWYGKPHGSKDLSNTRIELYSLLGK